MLPGCAEYFSSQSVKTSTQQNAPYSQSTIDDLLFFGASMTTMPDSSRADLCISLVEKHVEMRKSKKAKMIVEPKGVTEPGQNEADFLREKLEAIRSIDKQMNDSVDGN
jgi:hypothetical protein